MKTILCFGDSNTWGFVPGSRDLATNACARFPYEQRWPGFMARGLGDGFRVIEAGLNGRTTDTDDPEWADRNGAKALPAVLEQAWPANLVIVLLGVNDLKIKFARSPERIAQGLAAVIAAIRATGQRRALTTDTPPKILLISPPRVTMSDSFRPDFAGAAEKSRGLAPLLRQLAHDAGIYFYDAGDIPLSPKDGIHLDEAAHRQLGTALVEKIRPVLS